MAAMSQEAMRARSDGEAYAATAVATLEKMEKKAYMAELTGFSTIPTTPVEIAKLVEGPMTSVALRTFSNDPSYNCLEDFEAQRMTFLEAFRTTLKRLLTERAGRRH